MPRRTVLRSGAQAEESFQAQVLAVARLHRWGSYHTRDSRRSRAGYPDLTLIRPPRLLFVECKSADGSLSPAQQAWLAALRACPGVETAVWSPADWEIIETTLV